MQKTKITTYSTILQLLIPLHVNNAYVEFPAKTYRTTQIRKHYKLTNVNQVKDLTIVKAIVLNTGWLWTCSDIGFGSFLTKRFADCSFNYFKLILSYKRQSTSNRDWDPYHMVPSLLITSPGAIAVPSM